LISREEDPRYCTHEENELAITADSEKFKGEKGVHSPHEEKSEHHHRDMSREKSAMTSSPLGKKK